MLKEGIAAPNFSLLDINRKKISLSEFKGKTTVLYFYPKDNTPGCTRQACAFKNSYDQFKKSDIIVIGVSKDSIESHKKFVEKYDLPFILLSDPDLTVIKSYDVWQEKKLYGKTSMGVVRSTFIINKEGKIIKVFPKANPDTNAGEILEFLNK